MIIYVVKSGDTLSSIANNYNVAAWRIAANNKIADPNRLVVGQTIVIQIPEILHIVKAGENLYSIAKAYNTTAIVLLQNNPYLIGRPTLYIGEEIVIKYTDEKLRNILINGYAYPYINRTILQSVLPYLTKLTIFGYGFDTFGNLTTINDDPIIKIALDYGTAPIMLLSAMTQDGVFNSYLASFIFNNIEVQNTLIKNILVKMEEKNYYGLDIDFEFIPPEDAQGYQDFVRNVTQQLNAQGYTVNVDLAPKTSSTQQGLLYEAHDYAALGAIANTVLLMTYEWGYTFGPPLAVAPIPQVRQVLDYAVTVIDPDKIIMGIPNYGYDWTLPFVKGESKATVVGNAEAVALASNENVQIQFDEVSKAPFFYYMGNFGREHVVWFEDARSIQAKANLILEYDFLGAGYWNIMREFPQNWLVMSSMFNIQKIV